jgi:hypothetical protein
MPPLRADLQDRIYLVSYRWQRTGGHLVLYHRPFAARKIWVNIGKLALQDQEDGIVLSTCLPDLIFNSPAGSACEGMRPAINPR